MRQIPAVLFILQENQYVGQIFTLKINGTKRTINQKSSNKDIATISSSEKELPQSQQVLNMVHIFTNILVK